MRKAIENCPRQNKVISLSLLLVEKGPGKVYEAVLDDMREINELVNFLANYSPKK